MQRNSSSSGISSSNRADLKSIKFIDLQNSPPSLFSGLVNNRSPDYMTFMDEDSKFSQDGSGKSSQQYTPGVDSMSGDTALSRERNPFEQSFQVQMQQSQQMQFQQQAYPQQQHQQHLQQLQLLQQQQQQRQQSQQQQYFNNSSSNNSSIENIAAGGSLSNLSTISPASVEPGFYYSNNLNSLLLNDGLSTTNTTNGLVEEDVQGNKFIRKRPTPSVSDSNTYSGSGANSGSGTFSGSGTQSGSSNSHSVARTDNSKK
jgi:hypothetical protein